MDNFFPKAGDVVAVSDNGVRWFVSTFVSTRYRKVSGELKIVYEVTNFDSDISVDFNYCEPVEDHFDIARKKENKQVTSEKNTYKDNNDGYYSRYCPFRLNRPDYESCECIGNSCMAWIGEFEGRTTTGRGRCGMVHPIIPLMTNPV